jgi:hypothetical protein
MEGAGEGAIDPATRKSMARKSNGGCHLAFCRQGLQVEKRRPFEAPFEAQGKQGKQGAALQMGMAQERGRFGGWGRCA